MTDVPRSMEATTAQEAAQVARRRRAAPSGWWGVALFAATEATLFGTLIGSYFYLRFNTVPWPPRGIEAPSVALPLALTAALVLTSLPMLAATVAARGGRTRRAWSLVFLALVVQGGYLAVQIVLYIDDLGKFSPDDNAYGSIYFTLLGTHHAHVVGGILLSLWLLARLLGGLTNYRVIAVRVIALYWYFVNAVAIFVVATHISPS